MAEALVSKGLAGVVRHRQDDDNRASGYDQLLMAEDRYGPSRRPHTPLSPPSIIAVAATCRRVTLLTEQGTKGQEGLLQRQGRPRRPPERCL